MTFRVSVSDDGLMHEVFVAAKDEKSACAVAQELALVHKDWVGWPAVEPASRCDIPSDKKLLVFYPV